MSTTCPKRRRHERATAHERGAILLEFALLAPLLMIVSAGITAYGITIRRMQVASEATRYAGRVAQAFSAPNVPCGEATKQSCAAIDIDSGNASVVDAAVKGSCQYLQNEKYTPGEWEVEANIADGSTRVGFPMSLVTVTVRRTNGNFLVAPKSTNTYALDGGCS